MSYFGLFPWLAMHLLHCSLVYGTETALTSWLLSAGSPRYEKIDEISTGMAMEGRGVAAHTETCVVIVKASVT